MIKPTIGRVVLWHPDPADFPDVHNVPRAPSPRFRADVCWVNDDGTINLLINDHEGNPLRRLNVVLRQDGEVCGPGEAEWMPYQKAVAAGALAPTLHAIPPDATERN